MGPENHMVLEEYKVEGESPQEMFRCYVERNASLTEKLEMFFEHWHPLEVHDFIERGRYQSALQAYDVNYTVYMLEQSGADLSLPEALDIYEEIMK